MAAAAPRAIVGEPRDNLRDGTTVNSRNDRFGQGIARALSGKRSRQALKFEGIARKRPFTAQKRPFTAPAQMTVLGS
jgi:hypothetical protein